jgi:acetate---CoA ligase (ADP-forming)
LQLLDADELVDLIVLVQVVVRREYDEVLLPIIDQIHRCRKPVVVLAPGGEVSDVGLRSLHRSGIPRFAMPSVCARALRHLCDYADFLRRWRPVPEPARRSPSTPAALPRYRPGPLDPTEAYALLERYGVPLARHELAESPPQAVEAAARIGYPVALKSVMPGLLHKTEAGAVLLALPDEAALLEGWARLTARVGPGPVLVQEMVMGGVELIVGLKRDAQFGPVLVVGMGGLLVELLGDRALRLPPLDRIAALDMLAELHGARLLEGFRGQPPADVDGCVDVILGVSRLAEDLGEWIEALDLNPVIVRPAGQGARVVDVVVEWRHNGVAPAASM